MAHALRLGELTDELIETITGYSLINNARAFKTCKDASARALKSHRFGRTNQYAVRGSLNGLVEKFQILDNDTLAGALEERLQRLDKKQYKWAPEVLSLFLNLSDRPHEKSVVQDAKAPLEPDPAPQLTWSDIIADDPLETDGLWDDIDYGAASSGDDMTLESIVLPEDYVQTSVSISTDPYASIDVESIILEPDMTILDKIRDAQIPVSVPTHGISTSIACERTVITERQAIRDILHMLSGLPANMFMLEGTYILPKQNYYIANVSWLVFDDMLKSLAEVGTNLTNLRKWCDMKQSVPLIQSLQAATSARIHDFHTYIADLQKRLILSEPFELITLLSLETSIRLKGRMTALLWELIHKIHDRLRTRPFVLLDTLFEQSCDAQAAGDEEAFKYFAGMLLDCVQAYLRFIRNWMQAGDLHPRDAHFPIILRDEGVDPANFWRERYGLRELQGQVQVPQFLAASMSAIFASGKSAAFLKALGLEHELSTGLKAKEPSLTLENVHPTDNGSLAPFADYLQRALQRWIISTHNHYSGILKLGLLKNFGLEITMEALESILLSKKGPTFDAFSSSIFIRLDSDASKWASRSFLENLAQTVFGEIETVDPNAITVSLRKPASGDKQLNRTVKELSALRINYTYSWPVQNIIPTHSIEVYQDVFTLLLQIRRARYSLTKLRVLVHHSHRKHRSLSITPSKALKSNSEILLHHRLLHFVVTVESHILTYAVAISCSELHRKILEAADIDTMISAHANFITSIRSKALLISSLSHIHRALISCLDLALLFSELQRQDHFPSDSRNSSDTNKSKDVFEALSLPSSAIQKEPFDSTGSDETIMARHCQLRKQLDQLTSLMISGLRVAGRANGRDESWEILADSLEWHKGAK